ncbi:hypothetical protein ALNOE001_16230 [Candidatus Methanobinarius endosymbioticus]|uniref:Uncharacterized protein n=1 Tax=Candidatus Methanobinarius endosymbioticus TaxID=2006182 RepID=A0A366M8Y9_9EURY|nr:hypothetical protein ALNOE001_16230 [Candidatus Methanobinarius endosymbioticus]
MAMKIANIVFAKEYTGGKWKYNKYGSYKDFIISKDGSKYDVSVYSDEDGKSISITQHQPKGLWYDVCHGHEKEIINKNGKHYVGMNYKHDYKKQNFVYIITNQLKKY